MFQHGRRCPLIRREWITPRSLLLELDTGEQPFAFSPGQSVLVGLDCWTSARPFSIACSPERAAEMRTLELLIGGVPDGPNGAICEAPVGTAIEIHGPTGEFVFTPPAGSPATIAFIAGGTGIAPIRAMLDHALRRGLSTPMHVLYSARHPTDFAFRSELDRLAGRRAIRLHLTATCTTTEWPGARGRIGVETLSSVLRPRGPTLCFVAGPPTFVCDVAGGLQSLGVPEMHIRREEWTRHRKGNAQ